MKIGVKTSTCAYGKRIIIKSADSQTGISTLEGKIDALVYQLYGLSEDEVRIAEGKA